MALGKYEHYICQRAANAIISEIGPFRVSTDALQSINQFLDEFIVLLLTCSLSLDLSQIKSIVVSLLPSTLGKNAIVEAELEVKTFTETESIDYELYERMRNLGEGKNERFPLDEAVTLLREKCFEYCTLADKDDQLYLQKSLRTKRNETNMKVVISPIVAIYVTTIMEHIAEYLLTAVAMTAEHEDTDYVRVKEVFLALNDDIQLGDVFNRMDLKDKMEKRAGIFDYNKVRVSYLPTSRPQSPQIPTLNLRNTENNETGSFLDISFDDLDLEYFDENPRKSTVSTALPEIARPHSAMSHNSTVQHTLSNRKSTFHLFKHNRNSFSGDVQPRASSPTEDDSDLPVMNFDELIKSGGTVKVSLTPNRLRSIEIKDPKKEDLAPPQPTWERRSTSSPRLSAANLSRPSSPLVRQKSTTSTRTTSTTTTNNKKVTPLSSLSVNAPSTTSVSSSRNSTDSEPQKILPEVPKLNARPQTPSSPLSKNTFTINTANRFENPREAPKPPSTPSSFITEPKTKNVTPLGKLPSSPPTKISSIHNPSSDSIPSVVSSVHSMPSPILSTASTTSIHKASSISIQEPPIPRPTKSNTINTNGMLIRRSSGSSKKSRDNLRKMKEQEEQHKEQEEQLEKEQLQKEQEQLEKEKLQREQLQKEKLQKEQLLKEQLQQEELQREQLQREQVQRELLKKEQLQRELLQKEQLLLQQQAPLVVPEYEPTPTAVLASTDILLTEEPEQMEARQVHFEEEEDKQTPLVSTSSSSESISEIDTISNSSDSIKETVVIPRKKAQTLSPERPSSMVAKRASMLSNNRRRSLHETYATDILRQRSGSVSVSIKQWDDLNSKPEEAEPRTVPPVSHRRSVLRQLRQQQLVEEQQQLKEQYQQQQQEQEEQVERQKTYAVLDKVLKFESSIADHQRVSHMPRRERFLYLQQDPSAIERKSLVNRKTIVKPIIRRVEGVDQGVQTDPIESSTSEDSSSSSDSEHGEVDGDEEWFLQDSEWDEQEETAIVEWLLGE